VKITLVTYGTRGDAQPFLAVAADLALRGHRVRFVAPSNFASWKLADVDTVALPVDAEAVLREERAQRALASGDMRTFFRFMAEHEAAHQEGVDATLVPACEDADLLVAHGLVLERAAAIGAARKIPVVVLATFPVSSSAHYASPFVRGSPLPIGALNRLTHRAFSHVLWTSNRESTQRLRKRLGLAAAKGSYYRHIERNGLPMVTIASEQLFPRPADWSEAHVMTGTFRLQPELRTAIGEASPPDALREWMESGEPPIYMGFGSIPVVAPDAMAKLVRDVAAELSARVVLVTGWSALANMKSDERVHVVRSVNHDWLFPRCRAALHHGGAGTTAATARAGLPTVVCSVFADQPFWANRLEARGVGRHVPLKKMTSPRVVAAFGRLLDDATRERARAIAAAMAQEDGVSTAAAALEKSATMPPPP
jgi:sterol 3beta-glucosyltransferase